MFSPPDCPDRSEHRTTWAGCTMAWLTSTIPQMQSTIVLFFIIISITSYQSNNQFWKAHRKINCIAHRLQTKTQSCLNKYLTDASLINPTNQPAWRAEAKSHLLLQQTILTTHFLLLLLLSLRAILLDWAFYHLSKWMMSSWSFIFTVLEALFWLQALVQMFLWRYTQVDVALLPSGLLESLPH